MTGRLAGTIMVRAGSLVLAGALTTGPVMAATAPDADAGVTLLHLDAVGTVHEVPDLLCAMLAGTASSDDPATAQRRLDTRMKTATDLAGRIGTINWSVDGYGVDQNGPNPKTGRSGWTAHQTLHLGSGDAATLLDLVGRLQAAGLTVDSLQWELSPSRRTDAEQRAFTQALKLLRTRADSAAATLGLKVVGIRSVTLGEQGRVRPMPMASMMAAATPQATRSDTEVSQTAEADIALAP